MVPLGTVQNTLLPMFGRTKRRVLSSMKTMGLSARCFDSRYPSLPSASFTCERSICILFWLMYCSSFNRSTDSAFSSVASHSLKSLSLYTDTW